MLSSRMEGEICGQGANKNKHILSRPVQSIENNPISIDVIALALLSSQITFHIHIKGMEPLYCPTNTYIWIWN